MDNVYEQLKQKMMGERNIDEIFTKEKMDIHQSAPDIYREIAFGEMPVSQPVLQVK